MTLPTYKQSFIELALREQVIQFGQFTLKSGRVSPYFFNAGLFFRASALRELGQVYAKVLIEHEVKFDHLFGPAYKGLPLATATAIALAEHGIETTVTFNRKEIKDHGEGGQLIGSPLTGRTLIIDDVITAGTAFREAQQQIQAHGGHLTAVIIALDRCERGHHQQSTLAEIESQGISVYKIITLFDLIDYFKHHKNHERVTQIENYLSQYR